jgi:transposase
VTLYHMLKRGTSYRDLGSNYFGQRNAQAVLRRSVRCIETLGYKVTLEAS